MFQQQRRLFMCWSLLEHTQYLQNTFRSAIYTALTPIHFCLMHHRSGLNLSDKQLEKISHAVNLLSWTMCKKTNFKKGLALGVICHCAPMKLQFTYISAQKQRKINSLVPWYNKKFSKVKELVMHYKPLKINAPAERPQLLKLGCLTH